jgi:hypothetical protein
MFLRRGLFAGIAGVALSGCGPAAEPTPTSISALVNEVSLAVAVSPGQLGVTLHPPDTAASGQCPQLEPAVAATVDDVALTVARTGGPTAEGCGDIVYTLPLPSVQLSGPSLDIRIAQDFTALRASFDPALLAPTLIVATAEAGTWRVGETVSLQIVPETSTIMGASVRFLPAGGGSGFVLQGDAVVQRGSLLSFTVPAGGAGAGTLFVDGLELDEQGLSCSGFVSCDARSTGFASPSVLITFGP